ncbi:MAG: peptidoglycan peptidase, partial [Tritonibacter mobilis]|nr:peptidoglycan peptidase [Tritonibacter mobilis]
MKLHGMIVAGALSLASAAMSDEPDWARLMAEAEWDWRPGDLIFRNGLNDADDVLKHALDSPWATVGILRASSGGPRVVYVDETEGVTEVMLYRFVEELTPEDYAVYRIESLSSTLEDGQQLQGPLARYALNVAFGAPFDVQFQLGNDAYYSAELIYEAAMSAGVKLAEPVTLASLA